MVEAVAVAAVAAVVTVIVMGPRRPAVAGLLGRCFGAAAAAVAFAAGKCYHCIFS